MALKQIFTDLDLTGNLISNFKIPTSAATNNNQLSIIASELTFFDGTGAIKALSTKDIITATDLTGASNANVASTSAIKTYVDNATSALAGGFRIVGDVALTANADYPKGDASTFTVGGTQTGNGTGAGLTIAKGDAWLVSSGNFQVGPTATNIAEPGDIIVARIANATNVDADWTVVQNNIGDASTTIKGVVRLATVGEAETKTDSTIAVTPAGLATFSRMFRQAIDLSAVTTIQVTHNLGTTTPVVQVWDTVANTLVEVAVSCVIG